MFFTVYKITNNINGKIYIGAHSTKNLNDNYMGSSKHLLADIKIFGKSNFIKETLFIYNNKIDMLKKEAELVNKEFCYRNDTYNRMIGGITGSFNFENMTCVYDKSGNIIKVYVDDPRFLNGEFISIHKNKINLKGKDGDVIRVDKSDIDKYLLLGYISDKVGTVNVKDKNNNIINVSIDDERYISGELSHICKNRVTVKDKNGNYYSVMKDDNRYLSGELVHNMKDIVIVKDKNNNIISVNKNDERYISGELISIWKGRKGIKGMLGKKRTTEEKEHLRNLAKNRIGDKASCYGRIYINNGEINKRIKTEDLEKFLKNGWKIGRKSYKK